MIIARAFSVEPDLLIGNETQDLIFYLGDSDEVIKRMKTPESGWTHNLLDYSYQDIDDEWEAYLGEVWVGSSEI
jgi:inactivated superfamily I helicase